MNYKISFRERAEAGKQILARQLPISIEQAKKQVLEMKEKSAQSKKKN